MKERAKHLLFIDESGGHDLKTIDPGWPVFVLVGLLVGEKYYQRTLVPRVKELKERHGVDASAVLHSRDIRRWSGAFSFLKDTDRRESFYSDLNKTITDFRMRVFTVVIQKERLRDRFLNPPNPYDVSLSQLLSLVCGPPGMPSINRPVVSRIVAESRGKKEDKELQGEYQSFQKVGLLSYGSSEIILRKAATVQKVFPQRVDFVKKEKVIAGLELADLVAYPIGKAVVNNDWDNPAYRIVARKIRQFLLFP